jgi:hypothetical protein
MAIDVSSGISAANMVNNYELIGDYLDKRLIDKHSFETFVFYFLLRLVLINLSVEQTDVPMVLTFGLLWPISPDYFAPFKIVRPIQS